MDHATLKAGFPFCREYLHLNNAGFCPSPQRAMEEVCRYQQALSSRPLVEVMEQYGGRDRQVRHRLARLLNVAPQQIAITHNTAEGLNVIAQGFPFQPGDRVISGGKEYPANIYPWMNLAHKGVELVLVPEREGRIDPEDIEHELKQGAALVSLSFVNWCSGFRNDLDSIAALCRGAGVPLVVDGAQGVGALPLYPAATGISALACPAWKWLWGPSGLAFLYMEPTFMERIRPVFVGADGVAGAERLLDYRLQPRADMRRFEYATKNFPAIILFAACLELSLELGILHIEERLLEVTDQFRMAVKDAGGQIFGAWPAQRSSGIFSFTHPARDAEQIKSGLVKRGAVVNTRDGRVRVAPHIYLDGEDAARFATLLAEVVKG